MHLDPDSRPKDPRADPIHGPTVAASVKLMASFFTRRGGRPIYDGFTGSNVSYFSPESRESPVDSLDRTSRAELGSPGRRARPITGSMEVQRESIVGVNITWR